MIDLSTAEKKLAEYGQEHILKGFSELSPEKKERFLSAIEELDLERLKSVFSQERSTHGTIEPLYALTRNEIEEKRSEYEEKGLSMLAEGKCAAIILAGGMGTRLGSDKPKGELSVGETREFSLFECLVNTLKESCERAKNYAPLYIMTSEKNDKETRRFFKDKAYFGYPEEKVFFFVQDTAPAVDLNGKLLLEAPGEIASSPNGNGGWFKSLEKAGLVSGLKERGVEWLNIFSVDNPLQKICDPVFLGATAFSNLKCSGKVIKKNSPDEKLGVICLDDGRPSIVEYYEMTDAMHDERDENGELKYAYGVILNYLFRVDALEAVEAMDLPVHSVKKKIPFIDSEGNLINPEQENGFKFEFLILDLINLIGEMLPFEVEREKEFAPIKNLHGVDSLDSARLLLKKNDIAI